MFINLIHVFLYRFGLSNKFDTEFPSVLTGKVIHGFIYLLSGLVNQLRIVEYSSTNSLGNEVFSF